MLAMLALLLLALGGIMARTIVTQRNARAHVFTETEAIFALKDMLGALVDAETGERGYLLAGETRYLEPLENAKVAYADARAKAERYITRSPVNEQQFDLSTLDRLVGLRLSLMGESLDLVRQGRRSEAVVPARFAAEKARMDAVRVEVQRMEKQLLERRADAIETAQLYEKRMSPLLVLVGIAISVLVLVAVLFERRHAVAATKADQAEALRVANERTELVARELNHRVKNLFAVVLSIVSLTGRSRKADRDTMNELRARIHALSIAHAASQGQVGSEEADMADVIRRILAPYADMESGRISLSGPPVSLPVRMVTPIGLICHELATNAVKYGAFSVPDGRISIEWHCDAQDTSAERIALSWIESGGPALNIQDAPPLRQGFGSTMLDLAARQLGGSIERKWADTGAQVQLNFTLAG